MRIVILKGICSVVPKNLSKTEMPVFGQVFFALFHQKEAELFSEIVKSG